MCGILGSINIDISPSLLDLIAHRGPDDRDFTTVIVDGNKVNLGQTRLSIQDLTFAGHQPMTSNSGNSIIVFNGEIYNHFELRENLQDIKFNGHSDTETILNYLEKFGFQKTEDFNGIFAFAYLDKLNNRLILARDRFGVKPLYYYFENNRLLFSSEIRVIKKIVNLELNYDAVAEFLTLRYNLSPDTIYKNLFKVRPGHLIEIDLNNISIKEKPFVEKNIITNNKINFKDALAEYGYLFEQAIKRQLLADVEIGVLLSGGIDSALVAYFAQKHSSNQIKTFTVGFNEDDISNELKEAKRSSELIDTEHYEIIIDKFNFNEAFKKVNRIVEEPSGTTSQIPMYYLLQKVSRHVKVVLTGQGADEPLGGYPRYYGEKFMWKMPISFYRFFWNFVNKYIGNEKIFRTFYAYQEKDIIKRFVKVYSLYTDDELQRLFPNRDNSMIYKKIEYIFNMLNLKKVDPLQAMMSIDTRASLGDDLLLYTDKVSMNFSVEARVPILDNDLVEFIESLPGKYKIKGIHKKYIHKKFAESILPKEIIYRKKKGFYSPTKKWFTSDLGNRYKKYILENEKMDFLNKSAITAIFDAHFQGKRNYEKQIFQILSLANILE